MDFLRNMSCDKQVAKMLQSYTEADGPTKIIGTQKLCVDGGKIECGNAVETYFVDGCLTSNI